MTRVDRPLRRLGFILRDIHAQATSEYWGFRPRAKTGLEYTRKQQQYQDNFSFTRWADIAGFEVNFIFLGQAKWELEGFPWDESAVYAELGNKRLFFFRMGYSRKSAAKTIKQLKRSMVKTNGTIDVDPRILNKVYNSIQKIAADFAYSPTKQQQDYFGGMNITLPYDWIRPNLSVGKLKLGIFLSGEEAWIKRGFDNEANAMAFWPVEDDYDMLEIGFKAIQLEPHIILHELTHIVQRVNQTHSKFKGYSSNKYAAPHIDSDIPQAHPVEFHTYVKDYALDVVRSAVSNIEIRKKEKTLKEFASLIKEKLPNAELNTQWDMLFNTFKIYFKRKMERVVFNIYGEDIKQRNKFIHTCYDVAYTQLLKYAKEERIPGTP